MKKFICSGESSNGQYGTVTFKISWADDAVSSPICPVCGKGDDVREVDPDEG